MYFGIISVKVLGQALVNPECYLILQRCGGRADIPARRGNHHLPPHHVPRQALQADRTGKNFPRQLLQLKNISS